MTGVGPERTTAAAAAATGPDFRAAAADVCGLAGAFATFFETFPAVPGAFFAAVPAASGAFFAVVPAASAAFFVVDPAASGAFFAVAAAASGAFFAVVPAASEAFFAGRFLVALAATFLVAFFAAFFVAAEAPVRRVRGSVSLEIDPVSRVFSSPVIHRSPS